MDPVKHNIDEVLTRGVEAIFPSKEALKQVLLSGKKLKIYTGIDPTGPCLHLGHAVVLRKLRHFQDMGHEVILLIGDFTGMIGDPTDKLAARVPLTREQVLKNCKNYKEQIKSILDFENKKNPVKIVFNSDWLGKLSFREGVEIASIFTVQQMLERDMFQERMKNNKPISLQEFFYPLMQGYDSVALDVDMEIGGNDQTFNMLAGRDLMKAIKNKEKFVLTTKLLVDPSGRKMGKTEGNMITLADSPDEMYGKVMNWPDGLMVKGFEICTNVLASEIKNIEKELADGEANPRDIKMLLAKEVVENFHGAKDAHKAEENFIKLFQKKEISDNIREIKAEEGSELGEILVKNKIIASKSEFARLAKAGAVDVENTNTTDIKFKINKTSVVKVGKKKFVKISVN